MKPFAKLLAGAALLAMVATVWPLPVKVVKCFGGGGSSDFCVISTNAISFYYRLNESASGPFVDAAGQMSNLSATGSPLSYSGKITNCIGFDNAKTQYLSTSSVNDISNITNGDASVTCWLYTSNNTTGQVFVHKGQYDNLSGGWDINMTPGGLLQMSLLTTNGMGSPATVTVQATNFGSISSNTWYFVCAQFCRASNYCAISVNDGPLDKVSVLAAYQPKPSSVALRVGASTVSSPPFAQSRVLGLVDELAKWNRLLATNEVTCLYHAGAPTFYQTYPFQ